MIYIQRVVVPIGTFFIVNTSGFAVEGWTRLWFVVVLRILSADALKAFFQACQKRISNAPIIIGSKAISIKFNSRKIVRRSVEPTDSWKRITFGDQRESHMA